MKEGSALLVALALAVGIAYWSDHFRATGGKPEPAAAPAFLAPGGWLLMEHGYDQAAAVRALLAAAGFVAVESACDLAGIERVTLGRYPAGGVDAGARQA